MNLPTPDHLALVAAVLRIGDPSKSELQNAEEALGLWQSCFIVLSSEEERIRESSHERRLKEIGERWDDIRENHPDLVELKVGDREHSEVLNWIQENAEHPRDQFKTFTKFMNAWREFSPGFMHDTLAVWQVKEFLESRREKRLKEDRDRKVPKKPVK